MEQHPVPQNITSFQFRLIGDMTVKQFGYLAGGIILAFIFYKLPLPFFFTWPMAALFAFTGFGFAFVPIEERPMDIWVFSFLKNVYNPTIFHWEHTENPPEPPKSVVPPPVKIPQFPSIPTIFSPRSAPKKTNVQPAIPTPAPPQPQPTPAHHAPTTPANQVKKSATGGADGFFAFIDNLFVAKPKATPAYVVQRQPQQTTAAPTPPQPQLTPQPSSSAVPIPTPSVTGRSIPQPPTPQTAPLPKDQKTPPSQQLASQLELVRQKLQEKTIEKDQYVELQTQLATLMKERETMEKELIALRSKTTSQPSPQPPQLRQAGVVAKQAEPTVKVMNTDVATRMGLPRLTTFPNVVTGIIKDYENNLLPGVLVTVKDKDAVPLRALKTNKLGQFAASTQLPNGTYMVEVEDPRGRFLFDRVQITLNGAVMPALQIIAKSKRMLEREVLEKQIFGTPNASV